MTPYCEPLLLGNDLVHILHHLQSLVTIVSVLQPHALTDEFEDVNNAEWPIALVLETLREAKSAHCTGATAILTGTGNTKRFPAVCFLLSLFLMPETKQNKIWEPGPATA